MRIISQDNKKDFPYEMCTIWVIENKIFASPIGEPETEAIMADYTSQEKVEKAMETLHNYYGDYMIEKVYKQEIRSMCPVFQFPQEDEI